MNGLKKKEKNLRTMETSNTNTMKWLFICSFSVPYLAFFKQEKNVGAVNDVMA